ncbi:MAG: NAPDH-dependent diflavin reductase [Vezdaea aestivalis]|nr:MAG: NAPDH-dependent diflavin reductase [Vezdaea aestivalis]
MLPTEPQPRSALIAYGTETGNAQDLAETISLLTARLRYATDVLELDSILNPLDLCKYSVVIFPISTTGQGDLPSNSRSFWRRLLRRSLPPTALSGLAFSTFGIGDSSYPHFNHAARKLQKRLLLLGARPVHPPGEADEQLSDGVDGTFLPWLAGLRSALLSAHPLPGSLNPLPDTYIPPPRWPLSLCPDLEGKALDPQPRIPSAIPATLVQVSRLTPTTYFQDVRHLIFSIPYTSYPPGSTVTIYPPNPSWAITSLLKLQSWQAEADTSLTLPDIHPLPNLPPGPTTLRILLTHHLTLLSPPRRTFFTSVLPFATSDAERSRLSDFADPLRPDELHDYTTRPRRSILEVLADFPSVCIPISAVLAIFPPLKGRQFSIASGGPLTSFPGAHTPTTYYGGLDANASFPSKDKFSRVDVLAAIVDYQTILRQPRRGLCTAYLAQLKVGTTINVTLTRPATPIFPRNLNVPLTLVGTGTGVAPLRAALWERFAMASSGQRVAGVTFVIGARSKELDYYFGEEWSLMTGMGLTVSTAFSREGRGVYVQEKIAKQDVAESVRMSVKNGGWVVVCGRAGNMPRAVRRVVGEVLGEADGGVDELEKQGRWKVECW